MNPQIPPPYHPEVSKQPLPSQNPLYPQNPANPQYPSYPQNPGYPPAAPQAAPIVQAPVVAGGGGGGQQNNQQSSSTTTTVVAMGGGPMIMYSYYDKDWSSGLCGCFADLGSCCFATFCWSCFMGSLANQMDECPLGPFCLSPVFTVAMRTKLRTLHRIRGSIMCDCLTMFCCKFCAALQMHREMKNRGRGPVPFDNTYGIGGGPMCHEKSMYRGPTAVGGPGGAGCNTVIA